MNVESKPSVKVEYKRETKVFAPEKINSTLLTKMKEREAYLDESAVDVVITVHAYFNDLLRDKQQKDLGFIAGLNVLRVIKKTLLACFVFRGVSPYCSLISTASMLECLRLFPPSPLTGEQYGKWSRNTRKVVTARLYYILRGSLTFPFNLYQFSGDGSAI